MFNETGGIPDDFPAWMKQRQRGADWGLLVAAVIGLLVGWAFFVRNGVPAVTQGTHTAFMAADFADALREGVVVPLWSPHAQNGYGAPIPQFTPQGGAYVIALVELFFTDRTNEAVRLVMVVSLVASSMLWYSLVTAWGLRWGLASAALYVLSPFVGLTAPHVLADPALVISHAVVPAFLLVVTRWLQDPKPPVLVVAALVLGALGLVAPLVAVGGWGLAVVLAMTTGYRSAFPSLLGVGLAGAGICAPLWLPALLLNPAVTWLPSGQPPAFEVRALEMFTPVRIYPSTPQGTVGLLLMLALGGAWLARARGGVVWPPLLAGTVALAAAFVGCLVAPSMGWLVLATVGAALGASGVLVWLDNTVRPSRRVWAQASAVASVFALSLPVLATPFGPTTTDFSPAAQLRYEQRTRSTALLPSGHSLPSALPVSLSASPFLLGGYESGVFNRIAPTGSLRLAPIDQNSHASSWQLTFSADIQAEVLLAHFPGWYAQLDGRPLAVSPSPNGLLTVALPTMPSGVLRVDYGLAPPQVVAWLAVLMTAGVLALYVRRR
jgi:hypothetical protein